MIGLCAPEQKLLPPVLSTIVVLVTHGVGTNVESQTDGLSGMLHIAPTLNDILWGNLEGSRTILLLKAPCKEALVIVLPFQHS